MFSLEDRSEIPSSPRKAMTFSSSYMIELGSCRLIMRQKGHSESCCFHAGGKSGRSSWALMINDVIGQDRREIKPDHSKFVCLTPDIESLYCMYRLYSSEYDAT